MSITDYTAKSRLNTVTMDSTTVKLQGKLKATCSNRVIDIKITVPHYSGNVNNHPKLCESTRGHLFCLCFYAPLRPPPLVCLAGQPAPSGRRLRDSTKYSTPSLSVLSRL